MSDSGCSRDAGAARNIAKQHHALRPLSAPRRFSYPTILPSFRLLVALFYQATSLTLHLPLVYSLTHSLSLLPRPADPLCAFFLACALALPSATAFWLNPSFRAIPQRNRQRQLSNCHPSSIVLKRCCTVVVDDLYPQFCDGSSGSAIIQTAPGSLSVTRAGAAV